GVPAPQRALVLALPARRDRPDGELLRRPRPGAVRLVQLSAALGGLLLPRPRPGLLDPRDPPDLDLVRDGRDQLHRHDPQHAGAWDELDAPAALRLDGRDLRDPAPDRALGALGSPDPAPARPPGRNPLLPA